MRSLFLGLGLLIAVFLSPHKAEAQAIVLPCVPSGTSCIPVSAANPLPTTSAITAGTTTVTCSSGTTGILFQSSGKVGCTSHGTLDASGNLGLDGVINLTAGSVISSNASNFQISNGGNANMIIQNPGGESFLFWGVGNAQRLDWNSTTALTWTFPSTAAVTMASATVKLTGITTGTNADFLCLSATGVVLLQTTACTISSIRFKENIFPVGEHDALSIIERLQPVAFNMRAGERPNADSNFGKRQLGLTAENVAEVDPRMAVYEDDGVTPKSYRQEAVIAALVGAVRDLKSEFEAYKRAHP